MNEEELEKKVSGFGTAPIKMEGKSVNARYETTYVEVSMPVPLEEMAHAVLRAMRTQWLIDNGFEDCWI